MSEAVIRSWVRLIRAGRKALADVPAHIREEVKKRL